MTNVLRLTTAQRTLTASRVAVSLAVAKAALTVTACSSPAETGALSPSAVTASAEAKPGAVTLATMTFGDQPGDAISSDGQGAYPSYHGTTGCELLSGSALVCILQGSGRSLNYDLNGIISGTGPTGTLNDQSNFSVSDVGTLPIGSSMLARALFHTAIGQFNFNAAGDASTNYVFVTRVDAHTWTVDTTAGDVANLVHPIPDPKNPRKTITVVWGHYHLPFHFTAVTQ